MLMIDRRLIRSFDWISFFLIILLSLIGLMTVFSATYRPEEPFSIFYKKQLFGIASGIVLYIICCCIDYRSSQRWGYFMYFGMMALLFFTLVKGSVAMGGQRWINLVFFKFQPSELAKLFFAPLATYFLVTEKDGAYTFSTFSPLLVLLVISTLLILKQPDLGTAIIVFSSGMTLLWLAGLGTARVGKTFFISCIIAFLVCAPLVWKSLKPYQKQRILVFLGEGNHRKERYQIEQSVIAIGSGGPIGKGFLQGTQNKLQFLPEGRTDFIFSVFCEEWGFLGALVLLGLFALLFYRLFIITTSFTNIHAQLFAAGLTLPLVFSTLINICMVAGLLPTVGIPLPFMTYGISHLWMSYIGLGCVQSIVMRRFTM